MNEREYPGSEMARYWRGLVEWVDSLCRMPSSKMIEAWTGTFPHGRQRREITAADIMCLVETRPYRGVRPLGSKWKRQRLWKWQGW